MRESSAIQQPANRVLMYISKATETEVKGNLPQCIVSIITVSRKENLKAGLSGVLSYSDGYFLQIIEGSDAAIERLLSKLKNDTRHKELLVLTDRKLAKSYFNDKPLKLEPALESNDYFNRFIQENFNQFEHGNITPKRVIERALAKFQLQEKQPANNGTADETIPFASYEIQLKAWPRFNSKLPPREFMELCALISQPIAYPLLLLKNPYTSEKDLNHILRQLDNAKLLTLNKMLAPPPAERTEKGAFFFKMKNFLGRIRS